MTQKKRKKNFIGHLNRTLGKTLIMLKSVNKKKKHVTHPVFVVEMYLKIIKYII